MSEDALPADPSRVEAWLDEANRIHDDTPEPALALLRRIAPASLPLARRTRFAYLMNHVAGEKLGRWDEALAAHQAVVDATGSAMTATLWRQAAAAAHLAGDAARAARWCDALATASAAPPGQVQALVVLAVAEFTVPMQDAATAGRQALDALRPLAAKAPAAGLDTSLAAVANNVANHFVERPLDDLRQPELRSALDVSSELALQCWLRAGQWLQQERAHYLRALAANALGNGDTGATHARAGLALLDAQEDAHAEDVDRAFLELELAQGLRLAGGDGAAVAQDRAQALANAFGEAWLHDWFADRRQRNAALIAQYERGGRAEAANDPVAPPHETGPGPR